MLGRVDVGKGTQRVFGAGRANDIGWQLVDHRREVPGPTGRAQVVVHVVLLDVVLRLDNTVAASGVLEAPKVNDERDLAEMVDGEGRDVVTIQVVGAFGL